MSIVSNLQSAFDRSCLQRPRRVTQFATACVATMAGLLFAQTAVATNAIYTGTLVENTIGEGATPKITYKLFLIYSRTEQRMVLITHRRLGERKIFRVLFGPFLINEVKLTDHRGDNYTLMSLAYTLPDPAPRMDQFLFKSRNKSVELHESSPVQFPKTLTGTFESLSPGSASVVSYFFSWTITGTLDVATTQESNSFGEDIAGGIARVKQILIDRGYEEL